MRDDDVIALIKEQSGYHEIIAMDACLSRDLVMTVLNALRSHQRC